MMWRRYGSRGSDDQVPPPRYSRRYDARKAIENGTPNPDLNFEDIRDHFLMEVWPGSDAAYEHMAWLIARVVELEATP